MGRDIRLKRKKKKAENITTSKNECPVFEEKMNNLTGVKNTQEIVVRKTKLYLSERVQIHSL